AGSSDARAGVCSMVRVSAMKLDEGSVRRSSQRNGPVAAVRHLSLRYGPVAAASVAAVGPVTAVRAASEESVSAVALRLDDVLTGLSEALTLPAFEEVRQAVADPASPGGSVSLVRGLLPPLIARTAKTGTALVVTATTREAEDLSRALEDHLPEGSVAVFPSWETLPHERLSPRSDTVGERLTVLRRLAHPDASQPLRVVIAPVRAALQPLVKGLGQLEPVVLRAGDRMDLTELAETLSGLAYSRVDMVSRRGEFAVRGGIIDIFPPTADSALRLDFFDDEIEEIRPFAVADQRSQPADPDGPEPE